MIYYLSGKITAPTRQEELDNMKVFFDTESQLVARGFEVFNPAKLEEEGRTWEWYLAYDIKWINDNKPALYMLPGWKESRGARLEYAYAKLLHLCIVEPM